MKYLDIYGNTINLNIKQKEKIKTKFGGFISILSILSIIVIAWNEGKDILYKNNPVITKETFTTDEFKKENISSKDFPIALALIDESENIFEMKNYFEIEISYKSFKINENINSNLTTVNYSVIQKIKSSKCNFRDFRGKIEIEKFEFLKMNKFFCSDFTDLTLEGFWTNKEALYIYIVLKKCNPLNNVDCKSNKEIDEKLSKLSLLFIYLQPNLNFSNYYHPIGYRMNKDYIYINPNSQKSFSYQFQENQISTDSGWISTEYYQSTYNELQFSSFDVLNYDENERSLISIEITSTNTRTEIIRDYVKIGKILGLIGGLTKIYSSIFLFLNKFVCRIKLLEILINDLFYIKDNFNIKKNDDHDIKSKQIYSKKRIGLKFNQNNYDKLKFDNSSSNVSKIQHHVESLYKIKKLDINNLNEMNNINNRDNLNYVDIFSSNISGRSNDSKNKLSKSQKNNDLRYDLILQSLKKKEKKPYFKINCKDYINLCNMQNFKKNTSNKENLKKQKILICGQEKISQYLNFEKMIEKYENIEIIKNILFDKYQMNVLDIICIATLDLENPDGNKEKKTIYKKVKNKNKDGKDKIYYERKLTSEDNIKKLGLFLENFDQTSNDKIDKKIFEILLE